MKKDLYYRGVKNPAAKKMLWQGKTANIATFRDHENTQWLGGVGSGVWGGRGIARRCGLECNGALKNSPVDSCGNQCNAGPLSYNDCLRTGCI